MRVLKIVAEGITTSFRYPHFMLKVHPSFEMPPPATIYGHIASALGDWFDPEGVRFAYRFSFEGKTQDLEHIYMLSPTSGVLFYKGEKFPGVLGGNMNPFSRDLLFKPKMILYINKPEWENAFRSPKYAVVLGRSQDLFTYTSIGIVDLVAEPRAYFEHTLLPYSTVQYTNRGYAVTMPRYLDYSNRRSPTFRKYFIVRDRLESQRDFLWFGEKPNEIYWTDPHTPEVNDAHLGLAFLSFTGEEDETIVVS